MALQPPDPRTFSSWEDAFQYPLPVVRKLEQQLRKTTDENRQKLRSLVGASYRDLLGTAERIIEMDEQMQRTETYLGDIGRKCNARSVERVGENYARMKSMSGVDSGQKEKNRTTAQAKVLQNALAAAGRVMKTGGDALLVAKLLVLARLLHKGLSDRPNPLPVLDDFRKRLTMLRKKLLAYTERMLVRPGVERTYLANTLCAYALITNSAPQDVLMHFLQTRFDQLENTSEQLTETELFTMLDLYCQTVLDGRALFPKAFAEAVTQLSRTPLLQDAQIRAMSDLNLDIYGLWIAEDIRTFTPWIRHDQLSTADVGERLTSWAKQAQKSLLQAITDCLKDTADAKSILNIRKSVMSQYLGMSGKIREESHKQAVPKLQKVFLDRLESLIDDTAKDASLSFTHSSTPEPEEQYIWRLSKDNIDFSHGALAFRQSVLQRRNGRDDTVQSNATALDTWLQSINDLWQATEQMRAAKWDDDLDLDLDDIPDSESPQTILSKQDPEQLENKLREATTTAVETLYTSVKTASESEPNAILLLRTLREIDQRRRALDTKITIPISKLLNTELVSILHTKWATQLLESPMEHYTTSLAKSRKPATALWDGEPALPMQPTPATFRLLTTLHKAIESSGTDLCSAAAISVLKIELDKTLAFAHSMATTEIEDEMKDDATRNAQIQRLFDVLYLQRITTATQVSGNLQETVQKLQKSLNLSSTENERMRKSATEYWRRTYLLFGLLSPSS